MGLEEQLQRLGAFTQISQMLQSGRGVAAAFGLSQIHKAQFIHGLCVGESRGALVVTADEPSAVKLCEEINRFFGEESARHYPARDFALRSLEGQSMEYEHKRLSLLAGLLGGSCPLVVASAEAAAQYTMPPELLRSRMFTLRRGQQISTQALTVRLLEAGYQRVEQVEGLCQFSLRGGILDVFPPDSPFPIRAEFWGDEIDTLASFRIDTQRREDAIESLVVSPAREVLCPTPQLIQLLTRLAEKQHGKYAEAAKAHIAQDLHRLEAGLPPATLDNYLTIIYPQPADLYDYLGDHALILCETTGIKESLRATQWQLGQDAEQLLEEGLLTAGAAGLLSDYTRLVALAHQKPTLLLESFARSLTDFTLAQNHTLTALQLSPWGGELETLLEDLRNWLSRQYCVVVLAGTDRGADILTADLQSAGLSAHRVSSPGQFMPGNVLVCEGGLSCGFEYPALHLAVVTASRVRQAKRHTLRRRERGAQIRDIADLSVGDHVVHIAHGIGIFEGIVKKEVQGVVKDYIKIRYGGTDMLFVPVTQLDLVTKYIGGREEGVRLSRLNSAEWSKTRQRVKSAVSDMAKELIALYAQRLNQPGHAFAPDTDWQREFEAGFIYTETDDQLRCVAEIKADMERSTPMDRLLCGDVGFGKTEVALRAVFKCVMEGKQCAVMVPTTILAWQHFQTFRQRMEGYPIQIELLSRFRTPRQQAEVVKRLAAGSVDVVVGTHRLVQKDIRFKDLGLVIIDEEQRFGVAHKERMKELRGCVDVLNLSATPIPRTLNMAMSGIRDMSTIDEAPQDRHPVQTYVLEHDEGVIVEAIKRELRRGGQVFYLHNRIASIESCAGRLQQHLPDAKIVVAHGRMSEEQLSRIWRSLLEGETDVLVCTTIIEAGVDVPNCNTLIIEDADHYGLSQLYQIRGRVGRSTRRAFAYLTFRPGKVITEVAEKRLAAIKEFTAFGSGFRIAMRDLEIRGAGDILGSSQHGHMEAVGYDLYLQLLSEAVAEQKGEPVRRSSNCTVDVQMGAHIPEEYISSLSQRIDIYKKIAAISDESDSMDVTDELIDRFGEPPKAVLGLIEVALLRGKAAALGVREISQQENKILIYPETLDMAQVATLAAALKGRVMVTAGEKPYITIRFAKGKTPVDAIREFTTLLGKQTAAE